VAQLAARLDGIEEVEGSNPFGSTKTPKQTTFYRKSPKKSPKRSASVLLRFYF
jgi:hypothetical protein